MSENKTILDPSDGCLFHAGILTKVNGEKKLTSGYKNSAKEKFIQEVIDEITKPEESTSIAFPVGAPNPPVTNNEVFKDLADENKFKAFHELILIQYQNIAISLDAPSNFEIMKKGLPIVDPIALASQLEVKLKLNKLTDFTKFLAPNPALLASEFAKAGLKDPIIPGGKSPITPIGMLKKLTDLKNKLPNYEPPVPPIPTTEPQLAPNLVPDSCGVAGPSLHVYQKAFAENIVKFMPRMIVSAPSIAIQITTGGPTKAISAIAGLVESSGLVGEPLNHSSGAPQDVLMRAVRKVMCRKIAEMCMFHTIGVTLGSSVSGLVGLMAGSSSSPADAGPQLVGTSAVASKADTTLIPKGEESIDGVQLTPQIDPTPITQEPMKQKPPGATAEERDDGDPGIPHGGDRYDPEPEIDALDEQTKIKNGIKNSQDLKEQQKKEKEKYDTPANKEKEQAIAEAVNEQIDSDNAVEGAPQKENIAKDGPPDSVEIIALPPPPEEPLVDDEGFPIAEGVEPAAPRSYDLPADVAVEVEEVQGGSVRDLIVAKAEQSAGLRWSANTNEYSSCIFYAEFASDPKRAIDMAKVTSSCGVFARACLQAAGATYYLDPKDKSFKEANTSLPASKTYTPKGGDAEIEKSVGKQTLAVDYFNGFYSPTGSVVAALARMAKNRGALIGGGGPYKSMPRVKAGDILIIGEPAHVIVVAADFDPDKNTVMETIEGGQQDPGNEGTASYRTTPGILASAIKRIKHGYKMDVDPDEGEYNSRKITEDPLKFGKKDLQFAIDSEIFINGSNQS